MIFATPSIGLTKAPSGKTFHAGVSAVDISPLTLPALRNGGFLQASCDRVDDPLHARCLVIGDGKETVAIVIVDSCMFPRTLCDEIKRLATQQTGIPTDRILISATHTHCAPSAMRMCLGTGADEAYVKFVPARVACAIADAHKNLQPAKLGWAVVDGADLTNCRRWITRSDRMGTDPFGGKTVRAMMHPGYQNPNYTGPAGPIDPWLTVLSVVSAKDNRPFASWPTCPCTTSVGARDFQPITLAMSPVCWRLGSERPAERRRLVSWASCPREPVGICTGWTTANRVGM